MKEAYQLYLDTYATLVIQDGSGLDPKANPSIQESLAVALACQAYRQNTLLATYQNFAGALTGRFEAAQSLI